MVGTTPLEECVELHQNTYHTALLSECTNTHSPHVDLSLSHSSLDEQSFSSSSKNLWKFRGSSLIVVSIASKISDTFSESVNPLPAILFLVSRDSRPAENSLAASVVGLWMVSKRTA